MMPNIALDLEGTIANIHAPFVDVYNKQYGTCLTVDNITGWAFKGTKFESDVSYFFDVVRKLWIETPEKIPPTEENLGQKLRELSIANTIDIVTSAVACDTHEGMQGIFRWCNKQSVSYRNFVNLPEGKNKMDLNYNIYIDDSPKLAQCAKEYGKFVFLYDRPWNQNIKNSLFVKRVASLSDIKRYLKN
jgi:5'(3')-deoxyribonucleotidase